MTPQQIEFVGQLVTIAGGIAAATLALLQSIKTLLEVADQVAARRRRARRRGRPGRGPRRPRRGRSTGRGPARRGRAPP